MPRLFCAQTRQPIILQQQLASSGEGIVWTTANPQQLAKIYHQPTAQRQDKLRAMVQYAPQMSALNHGFPSTAWPQSLLMDNTHRIVGFLMPRIMGGRELLDIYNPSRRKRLGIKVNWRFLHVAAHNIASVITKLHNHGLVLGDIKPQNILVNNQAVPAIIDTDSFQVKNRSTGKIYPCLVGSEGFTPPELLGQDFAHTVQTPAHDNFRLGVIIYYLLFGSHPFHGQWAGQGDPPDQQQLIQQGYWVFGQQGFLKPSPLTIPLSIIYPPLQVCFWRCFQTGHDNPTLRPSAQEWQQVLGKALKELTQCRTVQSHIYQPHEPHCYWCDRQKRLKTDIFDHSLVPPSPPRPNVKPVNLSPNPPNPPQVTSSAPPVSPPLAFPSPLVYQSAYSYRPSPRSALLLLLGGGAIAGWILSAWLLATHQSPRLPLQRQSVARARIIDAEVSSRVRPQIPPRQQTAQEFLKIGYSKYMQSEFAEALDQLNQALALNPHLAEAYYYRGLVQKTLGDHQTAELDWQSAKRLAPEQMPFNPMFTALDLALPLNIPGRKPSSSPPTIVPVNRTAAADQLLPPISHSPHPLLPSVTLQEEIDYLLELKIEQINQDILKLKSEINREPTTIPIPQPRKLPQL